MVEAIQTACNADPHSRDPHAASLSNSAAGPAPMELNDLQADSLSRELAELREQLKDLRARWGGGRDSTREHGTKLPYPDPRDDSRWPSNCHRTDAQVAECLAERQCFLCFLPQHRWTRCPRVHGESSGYRD